MTIPLPTHSIRVLPGAGREKAVVADKKCFRLRRQKLSLAEIWEVLYRGKLGGSLRAVVPSKDKIRGEGWLPIGRGDMKESDWVYTYVQALGALYR